MMAVTRIYGGYPYYQQPLTDLRRLGMLPRWAIKQIARLANKLPAGIYGRNRLYSLRGGINQSHIWGTTYFDVELRKRILNQDVVKELGKDIYQPEKNLLRFLSRKENIVDDLTRLDFKTILVENYLFKADRASMANSLEIRCPFLDYRIIEHGFGKIPSSWKVNINERRRIQNLMAKIKLPKQIQLNRKQGFAIPIDSMVRASDLNKRLIDLTDLISKKELKNLKNGEYIGRANGSRLFALMMQEISIRNLGLN